MAAEDEHPTGTVEESVNQTGLMESMERPRDQSSTRERSRLGMDDTPQILQESHKGELIIDESTERTLIEGLEDQPSRHIETSRTVSVGSPRQGSSFETSVDGYLEHFIDQVSASENDMSKSFIAVLELQGEIRMTSPKHKQVYKSLKRMTKEKKVTTFKAVCPPPTTKRDSAAKIFSCMLDFLKMERLFARQDEPYGEIYLFNYKP